MRPWFKNHEAPLPDKIAAACSWPKTGGRGLKGDRIAGQCFAKSWNKEGITHVIVSPVLDEPVRVLDVLLHELCHAAVGVEAKHGKPFRDLAIKKFGLSGKVTATIAEEGTDIHKQLTELARKLGPYPHSAMSGSEPGKKKRPPGGGWVKLVSENDEGYILRISPVAYREHGVPTDPWGDPMKEESQ